MDIFDENHRKAHARRLLLGYFLITVIIALTTWLLVLSAQGLRYDPSKGVIQNALVYIDTKPVSANVFVDDSRTSSKTDVKLALPVGDHTIRVEQENYRTWRKNISLEARAVEFYTYIRLIPASIVTQDIASLGQKPYFFEVSPDNRWAVLALPSLEEPQAPFSVLVFDLVKPTEPPKQIPIVIPTTNSVPYFIEWADDSRTFLIELKNDTTSSVVVFDRESLTPTILQNLSSNPWHSATFYRSSTRELLALDNNANMVRLSLDPFSVGTTISSNVIKYTASEIGILLLRKSATDPLVTELVYTNNDGVSAVLTSFNEAVVEPQLSLFRFDGTENALISHKGVSGHLRIYRNPNSLVRNADGGDIKPTISLRAVNADQLLVAPNKRFIGVFGQGEALVYDLDLQRLNRFSLQVNSEAATKVNWYDEFRLTFNVNGKNYICDYDGTNLQEITSGSQDFALKHSPDHESAFSISQSLADGIYVIQRSNMVAVPNNFLE